MVIWSVSFNLAYNDGTASILEITKDEKSINLRKSNNVTWSICKRLPKFASFIDSLGGSVSSMIPDNVADYNFRFTATTTNGHIHVLGGSDALEAETVCNVDIATIYAELCADPRFALYFLPCAVFINTDYVDYRPGRNSAEASNLIDTLTSFGRSVSTFVDITSAGFEEALSATSMLFIPEMERDYLILDPAAKEVIKQWVSNGGTFFAFYYLADELINDVFDLSITQLGEGYGGATKSAAAVGSPLENGPNQIWDNDATSSVDIASLPPGSKSYYDSRGTQSYVASIPYGNGKIIFMGWDWYEPSNNDPGWLTVLDLLTQ